LEHSVCDTLQRYEFTVSHFEVILTGLVYRSRKGQSVVALTSLLLLLLLMVVVVVMVIMIS